eukprot:5962693-Pyramimonas_sp.AAC.1
MALLPNGIGWTRQECTHLIPSLCGVVTKGTPPGGFPRVAGEGAWGARPLLNTSGTCFDSSPTPPPGSDEVCWQARVSPPTPPSSDGTAVVAAGGSAPKVTKVGLAPSAPAGRVVRSADWRGPEGAGGVQPSSASWRSMWVAACVALRSQLAVRGRWRLVAAPVVCKVVCALLAALERLLPVVARPPWPPEERGRWWRVRK